MPAAGLVLLTLLALATASWLATRGFDRTDEGFYLNSIAHPRDDASSILLFGYAYHPFYVLVAGDLVTLRWVGMLLSVLTVGSLAWVSLKTPSLVGAEMPHLTIRVATSLGLSATALVTVAQMPLTPSYNTLTLQGLALAATGLILTMTRAGRSGLAGAVLLGVGSWLTFLGKPTTAGLLVILIVLVTCLVPGTWRRRLWVAAACLLLSFATTLVAAGLTPLELVEIMSQGLATSTALGGHDQILRLDHFPPRGNGFRLVLTLAAVTVLAGYVTARPRRGWRSSRQRLMLRTLGAAAGTCSTVLVAWLAWSALNRTGGALVAASDTLATLLLVCGVAIGATLLAALMGSDSARQAAYTAPQMSGESRRLKIGLLALLVLLPPAYAIGTNTNLWTATGRATCFWLLVLCILMTQSRRGARYNHYRAAAPLVGALMVAILLLASTAGAPYRYPALQSATTPTVVGNSRLALTPGDHAAVAELGALGRRLGVNDQTRVLDLTGDSPGSIFLLGARPAGQAWVIGGYPGSEAAARLAIEADSCAVAAALLFVAEGAPRAIPVDVLTSIGRDLKTDYRSVGQFLRQQGDLTGVPRMDPVTVYAPRSAASTAVCSK